MNIFLILHKILIWAIPVLFAITVHEVAHGYVASLCGDQTAKMMGRLTLNPIKHIDLIGTIVVPAMMLLVSPFIFGWAKPVPVDWRNLKNPRMDMAKVAIAGPAVNIIMAIMWGGIARLGLMMDPNSYQAVVFSQMGMAGIQINVILAVLNVIPIPPLDGSRVLSSFLSPSAAFQYAKLEPYGFFILIGLMLTGILGKIMWPMVSFLVVFIASLFGIGV